MTIRGLFARRPRRLFGRLSRRDRPLSVEHVEGRRLLSAVPTVAFVGGAADPLLGSQNAFTLRFDNAGSGETDVGFAPYVDLFMPVTGNDGVSPGTPAANAYDGIDLVSATYLGTALKTTPVTLVAGATGVPHPFAKDASGNPRMLKLADFPGAKAGDKVYVLELPLGSYTPSQPPVDIAVTTQVSNLADVGVGLPVIARGGFRYGGDPLDNPTVDPTIVGGSSSQTVTPALYRVTKENLAPENETATGPNFHQHYQVRVDVAAGQTLTNLTLRDVLPGTLQFVGASVTGGGAVTSVATPSTSSPGGTLERLLSSVVGTDGSSDAVMDIEYFVPFKDASTAAILDANTGDDVSIVNAAEVGGASWTPIDTRDTPVASLPTQTATAPTLVAKSIATQKSVSGSALPGSLLTYTINFQVSDFFSFEKLVLTDLLGDGQRLEGTPTLTVRDGHTSAVTTSGTFAAANFTNTVNKPATNGKDEIIFRVSDELGGRGFSNGRLVGGLVPAGGGIVPGSNVGGTTGTITFTARVQDRYDGTVPSGNTQLVPNDLLDNTATIAGDILSNADLTTKVGVEDDGTSASIRVPPSTLAKSVYAKNGSTAGQPLPATTLVTAGDTITYRLRYTLPNSSTENLKLTDFLPLPLFDVDDAGSAVTGFDAAASGTGNAPAPGKWTYGPADTYRSINPTPPTVGTASAPNSVTFDFGTFDDPQNRSSTIDILFTVTASNRPFADGLKLANRATSATTNSGLEPSTFDAIAEVTSSEPDLRITKGIVATDNPSGVFSPATNGPVAFNAPGTSGSRFTGTINSTNLASSPVDSNLSEVDANDLVTYCIVIENRGSGRYGAFDTLIQDRPPAGTAIPGVGVQGINLRVTDGAGNPLAFTQVGAGLFEPNGGIRLTDPSATQGAIRRGVTDAGATVTDGSNVVVITYDMRVLENNVLARLRNTGAVTEYAATEGGPDFTGAGEISDPAVITIATDNLLDKQLVSTEIVDANNALAEAVIGEFVTYSVTITVPEAKMPNAVLTDTLDSRLAFVSLDSVTTSPGVSITGSTTPAVTNSGGTVTFNLGTITNSDRDNATEETITFVYKAVVLNKANAQGGDQVRNRAALSFDGLDNPKVKQAAAVTIIEPQVKVTKSAKFDDNNPTGDADDPLTYTIVLSNPTGQPASTADAFDVTFSDALPKKPGGSLIVGNGSATPTFTVTDSAGLVTASSFELVGDDTAGYTLRTKAGVTFDMPVGSRTITIEVKGKTPSAGSGLVTPGDVITNTATSLWSSLDGDISTPRSPYNTDSVERTGSGTPSYNDYRANASADLRVTGVGLDKTVVATSESATTDPNKVVVGEIVRYRLVAVIPEGSTTSFKLEDQLPAGLEYLNDSTAKIALVSNGGGITSTTVGSGAAVNGNAPVAPTFVIPVGAILGGPTFGNGDDVTFDLGTVVNADSDADEEYAVIEFNALVTNVATNQIGTTLTNVVNFLNGEVKSGTSSTNVRVAEPEIQSFQKLAVGSDDATPAPGPFDAGDTVRYRVDVVAKNGGDNSIAYDTRVLDTLPATESLVPGSVRVFRNGTQILTGFTDSSAAGTVDVAIDQIAPGDEIRVFYDVVLSSAVEAGGTVTNTAGLTFTSLPGGGTASNPTGSTVPGGSGAADGERNGADGPGGPLNDYAATTAATIDVARPDLLKVITAASPVETQSNRFDANRTDFTVGEVVTYQLRATLPEGTTTSLVLSDLLPAGRMKFFTSGGTIQTRVVLIGGNITGSSLAVGAPGVVNVGAGTVTFDFGTVVNAPDNVVDANDQVVVELQVQVTNVPANVAGATIVNTGRLGYSSGGSPTTVTDTVTSDIVEPKLVTTKEIVTGGSTVDSLTVDTGDVVTYRVTVRHDPTSTGPAFSVKVSDTLPTGLQLVPGSVKVVSHPDYKSTFYDQPVVSESGNGFTATIDYLDVPGNGFALGGDLDKAVVEYQARVTSAVAGGTKLTNTARVSYDSLYGERPSNLFPDTTRNYTTSDPSDVTTREVDLAITKTDGKATYVPGLPITYTIVASNKGAGIVRGATVADTIPATIQNATWTVAYAGSGSTGPSGGSGNIAATIDLAAGGTAIFTVTGTVAATATGSLVNIATVTPPGSVGDKTPGDNTATDTDTPTPQADIKVTKTDNQIFYSGGQSITYVIVVTNDGPSFARSVRVRDTMPAQLQNVTWTAAYTGTGSTGRASGSGSIFELVNLAVGGKATYTVKGTVKPDASGPMTNVVRVLTAPGTADPTPDNNRAVDRDQFEPKVDLAVTKTDGRETFQPGTNAVYTIVVTNSGPGSAVNARVSDPLPAGVDSATWTATYSPSSSGPASGSGAIDALVTLLPGGSAIFTFTAAVSATATGKLANTATVTAPAGSVDTDPSNNSATDVDKLPAVALGPDVGCDSKPLVTILDPSTGAVRKQFPAYEESFRGGVGVTLVDLDGDGVDEVVTVPGSGRVGEVRVFDQQGNRLSQYDPLVPFGQNYLGGMNVAGGDIDGDGKGDLVVSMARGAGDVKVLMSRPSGPQKLVEDPSKGFRPFAGGFQGGATVAVADVGTFAGGATTSATARDGRGEIVVGSGPGMAPSVLVYDVSGTPTVIDRIRPFTPSLRSGVSVNAGRFNADPIDDILVSGGRDAGSVTEIYDGTVAAADNAKLATHAAFASLARPDAPVFEAGVDLTGDNRIDQFFAAQGFGGAKQGIQRVKADGTKLPLLATPADLYRVAASKPRADASLVTTTTGLQYRDVKVGTGPAATAGQKVKVHYVGSSQNGAVFDTSRKEGRSPFEFTLGTGAVIKGWDEGVAGMRPGGRRTLIIPADLAYEGQTGRPQGTLVFDVELISIG